MERCLIIPRFSLAVMILSLRCFIKDMLESSMSYVEHEYLV